MIIRAWFNSFSKFHLTFLFFLNFAYKKLNFFLETFMILNFLVGNFELYFFQISLSIALQHRWKSFLAQIVPFLVLVLMFLKLDFVQSLVILQTISHQHHSFLWYVSEMSFFDKAVWIASFYDSNQTIFSQINIFEAYFFDWMLVILYKGVSDVYACF